MAYYQFQVGDKVYIENQKRPFIVRACDDRYIICTRPYSPKHTVEYFIIDLIEGVRGTDNMVFCNGYETDEQCEDRLKELQNGEIEVSKRNFKMLELNSFKTEWKIK